ncbi:MAG: DDE-type integrase/transposase/recombinase, partial [Gemmatimonadetes bacterium]|nr:DDE-type integrase/transposase/recombinase [Gemmatimonadota bacterium]
MPSSAATRPTTPPCSPRSTKPSASPPDPPPRWSCNACTRSTATNASRASPRSPTATSTTSARPVRTGPAASPSARPGPPRSPSGYRRKPRPDGKPGHLRVDTVHLGDRERRKGIYLINVVDEVTQFQHLGAVPRITHHSLVPRLEALLSAFPFAIHAFHADNGSEYVNGRVAALLNQLHIGVFTKSRPRHPNDNALVET